MYTLSQLCQIFLFLNIFFLLGVGREDRGKIFFLLFNISWLSLFCRIFCMLHLHVGERQKQKLYILFFTGDKTRRDTVQCLRCVPSLDGYVSSSQKGAIVIWNSSVRNTRLVLDFMFH